MLPGQIFGDLYRLKARRLGPDGCGDMDLVPHRAKEREVRATLSNSFGFGGTNASVIFTAPN